MTQGVLIVGSINRDLTVTSPRIPIPGETILGTGHFSGAGGKGANQAVAVARLGEPATLVGCIGDDDVGRSMLVSLEAAGVATDRVFVHDELPTGLAVITLDESGENAIVVSPGANSGLDTDAVEAAIRAAPHSRICLAQLEVPMDAVERAAAICPGLFVLNPAPAAPLSESLAANVDVLVPNRTELGILAGVDQPSNREEVGSAVESLNFPSIVVTLGSAGALAFRGDRHEWIAAPQVEVVDTTGSGDAFCGALAVSLADGDDIFEATRFAVGAGAVAATSPGAAASMPTRDEVEALLSG